MLKAIANYDYLVGMIDQQRQDDDDVFLTTGLRWHEDTPEDEEAQEATINQVFCWYLKQEPIVTAAHLEYLMRNSEGKQTLSYLQHWTFSEAGPRLLWQLSPKGRERPFQHNRTSS